MTLSRDPTSPVRIRFVSYIFGGPPLVFTNGIFHELPPAAHALLGEAKRSRGEATVLMIANSTLHKLKPTHRSQVAHQLGAGGKPSPWFPTGTLVELIFRIGYCDFSLE